VRDGCFNVAYWKFAYEYYFSAISMEYIFEQSEMPEKRKAKLIKMNKILNAANLIVPVVYYFILCYTNILGGKTGEDPIFDNWAWFWAYTVSHYSVGVL